MKDGIFLKVTRADVTNKFQYFCNLNKIKVSMLCTKDEQISQEPSSTQSSRQLGCKFFNTQCPSNFGCEIVCPGRRVERDILVTRQQTLPQIILLPFV